MVKMRKWRLLTSTDVLTTPWLSVTKNSYQIPDGRTIDDYYVIHRKDFVLIIALDGDRLVLVRQYRPATDEFYLSLPAGYVELGESPDVAAQRELAEETGLSAAGCRLLGKLDPLPGYISSRAYVVQCELTSERVELTDEMDDLEINQVIKIEWQTVIRMIARGEINEMQAVAAILLAKELMPDF